MQYVPSQFLVKEIKMELLVEVLQYLIDDLHFDYEDGYFEWFDGTKLKIIEPVNYKDEIFYIYHNQPKPIDDIWQNVGAQLKLIIKSEN